MDGTHDLMADHNYDADGKGEVPNPDFDFTHWHVGERVVVLAEWHYPEADFGPPSNFFLFLCLPNDQGGISPAWVVDESLHGPESWSWFDTKEEAMAKVEELKEG